MFISYFSEHKNFGMHKEIWGKCPRMPPMSAGLCRTFARSSSFMFVQGARHTENLYLFHNMNSVCRLCKLIINVSWQIPIIGS